MNALPGFEGTPTPRSIRQANPEGLLALGFDDFSNTGAPVFKLHVSVKQLLTTERATETGPENRPKPPSEGIWCALGRQTLSSDTFDSSQKSGITQQTTPHESAWCRFRKQRQPVNQ